MSRNNFEQKVKQVKKNKQDQQANRNRYEDGTFQNKEECEKAEEIANELYYEHIMTGNIDGFVNAIDKNFKPDNSKKKYLFKYTANKLENQIIGLTNLRIKQIEKITKSQGDSLKLAKDNKKTAKNISQSQDVSKILCTTMDEIVCKQENWLKSNNKEIDDLKKSLDQIASTTKELDCSADKPTVTKIFTVLLQRSIQMIEVVFGNHVIVEQSEANDLCNKQDDINKILLNHNDIEKDKDLYDDKNNGLARVLQLTEETLKRYLEFCQDSSIRQEDINKVFSDIIENQNEIIHKIDERKEEIANEEKRLEEERKREQTNAKKIENEMRKIREKRAARVLQRAAKQRQEPSFVDQVD